MDHLWRDVRYAIRMLGRNPGFTVVAVLTLALGIGANTAIFSVVNTVLLRPLPFKDPGRLVRLWEMNPQENVGKFQFSAADLTAVRKQNNSFEEVEGYSFWFMTLTGIDEPERIRSARISANLFQTLGVMPSRGRTFSHEEERKGGDQVVILSHTLWHRRFNGDPNILGKTVTLDDRSYTVVGIMPRGFHFPEFLGAQKTELWTPLALGASEFQNRSARNLKVIARLKQDVNSEAAGADLDRIANALAQAYPASNKGWSFRLITFYEETVGRMRPVLLLLLGAVGLVLLIACANLANLLLARGAARRKEMAVRVAVGADRARLVRQLLTESLILAFAGGALGFLFAFWSTDLLRALAPERVPRLQELGVDGTVLVFTLVTSLFVAALFGLGPAVVASNPDLNTSLKEGISTSQSGSRFPSPYRLRSLLVVSEVSLAVVLLVGAGLMINSFRRLLAVDLGFSPRNILTMGITPPWSNHRWSYEQATFFQKVLERTKTLPGVESVGMVSALPIYGAWAATSFSVEGAPDVVREESQEAGWQIVSPDYFRTLGIPLLKGRYFTERDTAETARVAVINEVLARRYWPHVDPIGKRFRVGLNQDRYEVVGVVRNVRPPLWMKSEPQSQIHLSYLQYPLIPMNLMVRTASDPMRMAAAVRHEILAVDKDQPISYIETLEQVFSSSASIANPRFRAELMGFFAALALILAGVGVYGVLSHWASQRTHEMGIRVALGAEQRDILKLVLRQGMTHVLVGVGIGLVASLAMTRLISSFLYQVSPTDPITFILASALLIGVALPACYIPARRATKVDPMVALRYE